MNISTIGEGRSQEPHLGHVIAQKKTNFLPYISIVLSIITLGLVIYTISMISSLNASKDVLQSQINKTNQEIAFLSESVRSSEIAFKDFKTRLNIIRQQADMTEQELGKAKGLDGRTKSLTQRIKQQERTIRSLREQLAKKADTTDVTTLREEANTRLGSIAGDINTVKTDVSAARNDIETTRRELIDVRDYLSQQIAHNKNELDVLKRKGLRDYYEFDITQKNRFQTVGDIQLALKKADQKKKNYNVVISVDDNRLEKKNIAVTEPVQFLVGKSRVRYELVVYEIRKDRIVGYLSVPKDKALAAERAQP